MSDVCFILGAGASAPAGAPLMASFFDAAERALGRGEPDEDLLRVIRLRAELQRVAAKTSIDLYNLEEVFVAAEMASVLGGLGSIPDDDLTATIQSLQWVISKTIQESMLFQIDRNRSGAPSIVGAKGYRELAKCVHRIYNQTGKWPSVITFNYDIGLEFTFRQQGIPSFYGGIAQVHHNALPIYKLHGSINWFMSGGANGGEPAIHPQDADPQQLRESAYMQELDAIPIRIQHQRENPKTGEMIQSIPLIVPPTDSKLGHRKGMHRIWKLAANDLRDAKRIAVIGFSLPTTDDFFRHFFGISTLGDHFIERFVLVNPDPLANARYESLLSPNVKRRYHWIQELFPNSLSDVERLLLSP